MGEGGRGGRGEQGYIRVDNEHQEEEDDDGGEKNLKRSDISTKAG